MFTVIPESPNRCVWCHGVLAVGGPNQTVNYECHRSPSHEDHVTGRERTRSSECHTRHAVPRYYHHGGAQADEPSLSSSVSCFDFSLSLTHSEMLIVGFVDDVVMNRIPAISLF